MLSLAQSQFDGHGFDGALSLATMEVASDWANAQSSKGIAFRENRETQIWRIRCVDSKADGLT